MLKAIPPRRHLWTVTIFNRKVSCYTTKCIRLMQKYSIKWKRVCDKHMWSYGSIRHCLTVQKCLHSTSDSSALVNITSWQVNARNHSPYSMTASWNCWMWQLQNIVSEICYCSIFSLWETKCPTCELLIQKSDVTTIRLHFMVHSNRIFHSFLCC